MNTRSTKKTNEVITQVELFKKNQVSLRKKSLLSLPFSDTASTFSAGGIPEEYAPKSHYQKILKSDFIDVDHSKLVKDSKWFLFQVFKDSQLEKKFLDYFYGKKHTFFRISWAISFSLILLVSIYDFFTFAEGELAVKGNNPTLRIIFHVCRFTKTGLALFAAVALNVPYIYNRKFYSELLCGICLTSIYLLSTFLCITINERALVLTFFFCGFNLFRFRMYIVVFQSISCLFLYFIIAPFLEEDYLIIITSSSTLAVILLMELMYSYFYESIFRKVFISIEKINVINKYITIESTREFELLKNIFPESLIKHAKKQDSYIKHYKNIVSASLDIVDFTQFCNNLRSSKIINLLNIFFSLFDDLCVENNMEKVTTVGDGYIFISNFEKEIENAPKRACLTLFKMMEGFKKLSRKTRSDLKLRAGCSVGDVTIAIVGRLNRRFDVFGVNVKRMMKLEQSCSSNHIHVDSVMKKENENLFEFKRNDEFKEFESYFIVKENKESIINEENKSDLKESASLELLELSLSRRDKKKQEEKENKGEKGNNSTKLALKKEEKGVKKKKLLKFSKYGIFLPLLLFIKPFKMNFSFLRFNYETTRILSIYCYVAFFLLECVAFLNVTVFTTFNYYYFIIIALICFSFIYIFVFAALSKWYYFGVYSSAFFALIYSTIFIFGQYYVTRFETNKENLNWRLVLDLLAQFYPFLIYIFPTIPFFVKFFFVLISNVLLNILLYNVTGKTQEAFNFFCSFVCSSFGFFMFHYGTMLFYKKQKLLTDEFNQLRDEIEVNEQLLTSALPRVITERLLTSKELYYDYCENGSVLFAVVKNVENINFNDLVPFLSTLFSEFDLVTKKEEGCVKIKSINTDYLCVSGLMKEKEHKLILFEVAKGIIKVSKEIIEKSEESLKSVYCVCALHSGPFSGGVVGKRKVLYDCVGDVINTCHRYSNDFFKKEGIHCTEEYIDGEFDKDLFIEKKHVLKGKGECSIYKFDNIEY